jgi:hypothetical protein
VAASARIGAARHLEVEQRPSGLGVLVVDLGQCGVDGGVIGLALLEQAEVLCEGDLGLALCLVG